MTKRVPGIVLAGIVLTLFHTHPAFSQSSEELNALRNEIEALKQSHSALQKELQELKSLLQSRQAPPVPQNVVFSIADDPDRKSTRLNSSHSQISYAVFCLKKQN